MADRYELILKFIIIGDAGTGKSCILHQFVEGHFREATQHTIGVEFGSRVIELAGGSKRVKLQLWDTAGQERYRAVTRSYYRGAAGALLVFDVSSRASFEHIVHWLADARTLARNDISIIVVGNKSDLKSKRAVTYLEGSKLAQDNDVMFLETSALTGEGVEEAFVQVARQVVSRLEEGMLDGAAVGPEAGRQLRGASDSDAGGCAC